MRRMLIGGAGDKDGVDVGARKQLVQFRQPVQPVFRSLLLSAFTVSIPACDDIGIVEIGDGAAVRVHMPMREADDANAQFFASFGHGCATLIYSVPSPLPRINGEGELVSVESRPLPRDAAHKTDLAETFPPLKWGDRGG